MKKIFSLALGLTAMTTMSFAAVQQAQETVDCGTVKTITANPKAGYHFVEWNDHVTTNPREVTVSADITYTATFAANTNTAYTVKHYQQNIANDNYTEVTGDRENKTGTTATETAAEAKSYTGFTKVDFAQGTIAGDGSTVVEIYYTRNSYTLSWVTDGNALSGSYTSGSVKYGATITAPNTPTKTGYTFKGWSSNVVATMPASNTTYTATWTAASVNYTVKHYQQNVEGAEYTEVEGDRQVLSGTTGTDTEAEAKVYEGFNAQSFSQTTIEADGSTVVSIYYDRKTFTAEFQNYDGTPICSVLNVRYGASPEYCYQTPPTKPEDEVNRYEFSGWSPDLSVGITGNTTYIAQFNAIPKTYYTITTAVSPDAAGTITAGGSYESGTEITITASETNECYVFDHWADDNSTNPSRTITVTGNATYTAVFKVLRYTIKVESEDDTMGTVTIE